MPKPIITMRGISKRFPGVLANDNIDLDIFPGEIHALLGENGSGKSTLMCILSGLYKPDDGTITVNGEEYVGEMTDPAEFSQFVLTTASGKSAKSQTPTPTPTASPSVTP